MNDILPALTALENDPTLEQLEKELQKFNIFEAIGMVSQEIRHSRFLAFLLSPSENHGLGDAFLKILIANIQAKAGIIPFTQISIEKDFKRAVAKTEWEYIDIIIVDEKIKMVVVIENKIGSREKEHQLSRYHEVVMQKYQGFQQGFIYLTPDGRKPLKEVDQSRWVTLSYSEITQWLHELQQIILSGSNTELLMTLNHYTQMLRRHILTESDVAQLWRELYVKHKEAIDCIIKYAPTLQQEIASYINDLLNQSNENGSEFKVIYSTQTGKRIDFVSASWGKNIIFKTRNSI